MSLQSNRKPALGQRLQFQSQFIYLPLEVQKIEEKRKNKSNYLDSHGEEAEKKPAGL